MCQSLTLCKPYIKIVLLQLLPYCIALQIVSIIMVVAVVTTNYFDAMLHQVFKHN